MKQKHKKSFGVYVPVLLILLSLTVMVSSTFAYFTNTLSKGDGNTLTFGKVELSADTAQGISGSVMDAIPGTPLIDGAVSFSLSSTSKPVYVRAKISYSGDASVSSYLNTLRSVTNYGFTETANYHWTEKSGNYVYLVNSSDKLLIVTDTTTYNLTSSFNLPTNITNLPSNAQYMAEIQFHLEFQAIQADNISGINSVEDIAFYFDQLFPESAGEKIPESHTYLLSNAIDVSTNANLTMSFKDIEDNSYNAITITDGVLGYNTTNVFSVEAAGWFDDSYNSTTSYRIIDVESASSEAQAWLDENAYLLESFAYIAYNADLNSQTSQVVMQASEYAEYGEPPTIYISSNGDYVAEQAPTAYVLNDIIDLPASNIITNVETHTQLAGNVANAFNITTSLISFDGPNGVQIVYENGDYASLEFGLNRCFVFYFDVLANASKYQALRAWLASNATEATIISGEDFASYTATSETPEYLFIDVWNGQYTTYFKVNDSGYAYEPVDITKAWLLKATGISNAEDRVISCPNVSIRTTKSTYEQSITGITIGSNGTITLGSTMVYTGGAFTSKEYRWLEITYNNVNSKISADYGLLFAFLDDNSVTGCASLVNDDVTYEEQYAVSASPVNNYYGSALVYVYAPEVGDPTYYKRTGANPPYTYVDVDA